MPRPVGDPARTNGACCRMKTLVPLSGGIDSAVVLALLLAEGQQVEAIGFDYDQPHVIELERAAKIANHHSVPFFVVRLPTMPRVDDVVFAGRNLVLAAHAISMAHARGFDAIALGCNASDYERFPDCRSSFWKAVGEAAEAAYGIKVSTPLLNTTKSGVVELAHHYGVPLDLTWSCYAPRNGEPCGDCLGCNTRAKAGA